MSTVEFESFSMTDASMRPLPLLLATGDEDQKKATAAAQVLRAALSTDSASQLTPDVAATPLAHRAKFLEEALSRALSNDAASLSAAIEQAVASTHAAEVAHVVAAVVVSPHSGLLMIRSPYKKALGVLVRSPSYEKGFL